MVCNPSRVKLGANIHLVSRLDHFMPMLGFHCAVCGSELSVSDDFAGGVMDCPSCRRVVPVPSPLDWPRDTSTCLPVLPVDVLAVDLKFLCPGCHAKLQIDARLEGREISCPKCATPTKVPRWSRLARQTEPSLCAAEIEFLSREFDPPENSRVAS